MQSTIKKCTVILLGFLLSCPLHAFVSAQSLKDLRTQQQASKPSKLAPDLEVLLADDDEEQRQARAGKTLAQVRQERRARASQRAQEEGDGAPHRARIGQAFLPSSEVLPEEKQSFIVQANDSTPSIVLQEKVARLGGKIHQSHAGIGLLTIEVPRAAIRQLAAEGSIAYVSPDRPITATGHVEATTGAAQIRALKDATGTQPLDGRGVGIAVIDSGMHPLHDLIIDYNGHPGPQVNLDFRQVTDNWGAMDAYSHGTHVATLIAGNNSFYNGAYTGIAPNATLLNLRVLDHNGAGAASSVIAALDWCITNKATHNIRVINLSLGTTAKDSYKTDPLCLAARRAVNAGIVVVAAAGNHGKDANGRKMYGSIHSPGIEPSVITVGALNTFGTDGRADDVVTSYSSRGPTRGYTVVNNVRKYDNLIKPDLVAPGNKLIGAYPNLTRCVASPYTNDPLSPASPVCVAPQLIVKPWVTGYDGLMYLSGTSMAAPVVTGAVALMLQARPNLTPSLVKAILMYSAQPLKGFNMLEQGAGALNIDGAVRLAKLVKATLPTTSGAALLSAALPTQSSTIAGQSFKWGQGAITNYGFLYGSGLMTYWQPVYGSGQILGDATTFANGAVSKVTGKTTSTAYLKSGASTINGSGTLLADSLNTTFANGQVLGDGTLLGDGIILGDGVILGDGTLLADGTTRADNSLRIATAYIGDDTTCMKPVQ